MTDPTHQSYDPAGFAFLAAAEDWHFWFTSRNRLICWALRRHFPTMRAFCDVGCGTGATLHAVEQAFPGLRLFGVDYFPEGLVWAGNRLSHVTLIQGDIHDLPAAVRESDVWGAFDVLEHIPDDANALSCLYAAIRPGGGLILTVPQHRALWSASDEVGHHQRRYDRAELVGKVRTAGFEVLAVTSFVSLLLPLLWLKRRRTSTSEDAYAELRLGRLPNALFTFVMTIERWLIQAGLSLPAGGSLLLLARRT
jgi:SAM-dependent methyltransferase